jgi:hypothetical protein
MYGTNFGAQIDTHGVEFFVGGRNNSKLIHILHASK